MTIYRNRNQETKVVVQAHRSGLLENNSLKRKIFSCNIVILYKLLEYYMNYKTIVFKKIIGIFKKQEPTC